MRIIINVLTLLKTVVIFVLINEPNQISAASLNRDNDSNPDVYIEDHVINKHESLKTCLSFELEPHEYELYPNKTAVVSKYNQTYEEPFYVLNGDYLRICVPIGEEYSEETLLAQNLGFPPILEKFTLFGTVISILFLFIHITVFCMVPDLRNLPGCNLASLCLSLLLTYLLMLILEIQQVAHNDIACTAGAFLIQFFFLGYFLGFFLGVISNSSCPLYCKEI
ncbi:hypothetical protein HNY73_013934 [Argiope bruennichi]|uniref:Uncharacterized protein n=1 Tax=Argiope bruennichi TaxID=94029 RepID=A0A8T0EP14_ARGBR|nr:hypothetical protein HNY73_013934 [Argiope bruennichi]